MEIEKRVTCFNRYSGICKNCTEDYDTAHHPNNYDCKRYLEMPVYEVRVAPNEEEKLARETIKLWNTEELSLQLTG